MLVKQVTKLLGTDDDSFSLPTDLMTDSGSGITAQNYVHDMSHAHYKSRTFGIYSTDHLLSVYSHIFSYIV